jgi:hypothetical protein
MRYILTMAFLFLSSMGLGAEKTPDPIKNMSASYTLKINPVLNENKRFDYILPIKEVPGPVKALTLSWSGPEIQNFSVTVAQSHDLQSWSALAPQVAVSQDKKRIEFPMTSAPYLRLRIENGATANLKIENVEAEYATFGAPADFHWKMISGVLSSPQSRTYVFDLGSSLPIERVEILSPDFLGNGNLSGELFAADNPEGDGKELQYSGLFHRLSQSKIGPMRPASGNRFAQKRYWILSLEDHSPNLANEVPILRVGWSSEVPDSPTTPERPTFKAWFQRFSWIQILGAALALSSMIFFMVRRR